MGGLELGWVEGLWGKNPDPQTATIALGHLIGWHSPLEIPQQSQPDLAKVRLPFPEPQLLLGFWPPGKSNMRQGLTSCRREVTLPIPSLPPSPSVPIQQVLAFPTLFPKFLAGTGCQWSAVATRGGPVARE